MDRTSRGRQTIDEELLQELTGAVCPAGSKVPPLAAFQSRQVYHQPHLSLLPLLDRVDDRRQRSGPFS
jgi:hypothetical protein